MGFLGLFVTFGVLIAVIVGVSVFRYPSAKKKSRVLLENKRRLIDNDTRLIEVDGIWRASFFGCGVGIVLLTAFCLLGLPKIGDALGAVVLLGLPAVLLVLGVVFVMTHMSYGDTLRIENQRKGNSARHGVDVHKMHTVDNTQSEVLEKLGASNRRGPLVLLNQGANEVAKKAEEERRASNPWSLSGWRTNDEDRSLVVGRPGAGKTTFLIAQIIDWMNTGRPFVANDIKPEIWSILKENGVFDHFGYTTYVINPTDAHAHKFNLFAEIENDADLNEVLAVILPVGEGDSAVFNDNARRLLKAVMAHLGTNASLPAARDFIMACGKVTDLLDVLRQSEKKSVQRIAFEITNTAGNDRLLASIMTAMSQAFEFMDDETVNDSISSSDFKMKDVLMQQRTAVFLQFEQNYKSTLETLFGATVAYVLRLLQANAPQREHAVFVALDEIMNAAPIPKFLETLNTIRSARAPIGMYLQSLEGLNRLYGPGASEIFLGAADLKVIMQVGDNFTADYISAQLGETEQRSYGASSSSSRAAGASGGRLTETAASSSGVSYSSSMTRVIDPAEILAFGPGQAIVMYRGSGARFNLPRYDRDYPAKLRASINPRPEAGFVESQKVKQKVAATT